MTAKVYSKKTLRGNNLTELSWNIYLKDLKKQDTKNESANVKNRKEKSVFEKMPLTYRAFDQNVKCAHLQSLIFHEADKTVIEIRNPEYFGWKFDGNYYVAIATDNFIVPDTGISFASCNYNMCGWLYDYLDHHIFR